MKMHTFFLSGKAIAIVSGAFGACGMLLFVSGILVGVRVGDHGPDGAALAPRALPMVNSKALTGMIPGSPVAAPAPTNAAPSAAAGAAGISAAASTGSVSSAWPFNSSAFAPDPELTAPDSQAAPAVFPSAAVPQSKPALPRAGSVGAISMISYIAPADDATPTAKPDASGDQGTRSVQRGHDGSEYLVQVGTFRVEEHARELAERLTNAGYKATITVRQEGDRSLHVVRVGQFTGIDAAEKAAARIGSAEQLVASVVEASR